MTPPPAAPHPEPRSRKPLFAWLAFLAACAGLVAANGLVELRQAREAAQWRQQALEWNARAQEGYNDLFVRLSPLKGVALDDAVRRSGFGPLRRDLVGGGRVLVRVPEGFAEGGLPWTVTLLVVDDRVADFQLSAAGRPPPRPPSMLRHLWKRVTGALPILCAMLWVTAAASAALDRRYALRYGQYALAAAVGGTLAWLLFVGPRAAHPYGIYVGVALAATAAGLTLWGARHREATAGTCAACGYDLTGNVSGVCPECGTPLVGQGALPNTRLRD
jgi:hypothetical protein